MDSKLFNGYFKICPKSFLLRRNPCYKWTSEDVLAEIQEDLLLHFYLLEIEKNDNNNIFTIYFADSLEHDKEK